MQKIFGELGKGERECNYMYYIWFLKLGVMYQGFIILLFILLCTLKILHNLKVYTVEDVKKSFKKSQSKLVHKAATCRY